MMETMTGFLEGHAGFFCKIVLDDGAEHLLWRFRGGWMLQADRNTGFRKSWPRLGSRRVKIG